ncbi:class I SAM-dependent methyltransferase [Marinobacterium arenosum]|uniref:class I SAM-dependent methyltransferase n=1 Tax=Marinobacterium arenosum TaxID=2862496 RepID=UPI001C98CCFB|nr:class I SAM-dependent methyltransferase [Marinobacterium arenosum]MBY4675225.1 class I SAM-dependent methyltransferase [Marinobacterium arenosum]
MSEHQGIWDTATAEWYIEQWGDIPLHRAIPGICELRDGDAVLDIGCGSGSAVRAIAGQMSFGHVIGIDPTPRMIEIARADNQRSKFRVPVLFDQAGAEQIPAEDASIDLAIAVNTLHHWQDVEAGLEEVLRVLKPTGRFISVDDLWDEQPVAMTAPPGSAAQQEPDLDHHHGLKSVPAIVARLSAAGFDRVESGEYRSGDIAVSTVTAFKSTANT